MTNPVRELNDPARTFKDISGSGVPDGLVAGIRLGEQENWREIAFREPAHERTAIARYRYSLEEPDADSGTR